MKASRSDLQRFLHSSTEKKEWENQDKHVIASLCMRLWLLLQSRASTYVPCAAVACEAVVFAPLLHSVAPVVHTRIHRIQYGFSHTGP